MNADVFVLFFNAFLTTLISSGIVIWILRKKYLPVIKKLEEKSDQERASAKEAAEKQR
ncbi:hypothetical protein [Alteribacillus sp. HJP-4]|uniref:hypothetical protein n=1 Tax=Alteribacillus sp. HJP-4 TaxID=2775394 RepID=UPI0035CD0A16